MSAPFVPSRRRRGAILALALLGACHILASCGGGATLPPSPDTFDESTFRAPPRSFGPHLRWWWPGGAVDDATIEGELSEMQSLGFAGVELQTLAFGLSAADLEADPRVRSVGTPLFLERVETFLRAARSHELATTLTLGSGWPSGGVFATDVRPVELILSPVEVMGPADVVMAVPDPSEPEWVATSNALFPVVGAFDSDATLVAVLAAPVMDAAASPPVLGEPTLITNSVSAGTLTHTLPEGLHQLFFVHQHRVDHLVAGAAFPGEGADAKVVSHLDSLGSTTLLAEQSEPWLDQLGDLRPDEVFVDSFELVAELPWSLDFAARFTAEHGYDLTPLLPYVLREGGESKYVDILRGEGDPLYGASDERGERAREDYEDVRGQLFLERFVEPVSAFAEGRSLPLRLQGHGGYAHVLDTYAMATVPETEGLFARGSMDFLELAASAGHVSGRNVISSESFIVVNASPAPLTLDELWMLAGRAYVAGVNRLVYHGVAYPYARSNGEPWYPFRPDPESGVITAGPIEITSDVRLGEPGFEWVADFNQALTRLSYAMTRGVDRAEVAWLLDEREIPDAALLRIGRVPAEQDESPTSLALRKAGYGYDRISPRMLATSSVEGGRLVVGSASYRALLISSWPSANADEVAAARRALAGGVPVIVLGTLPERARGLTDADARDALVATEVDALRADASLVDTSVEVPTALAAAGVLPDVSVRSGDCITVSLAHRELADGDLFLLFNEHTEGCTATLDVRTGGRRASLYDPLNGSRERLPRADEVTLDLASRRPRLLVIEGR